MDAAERSIYHAFQVSVGLHPEHKALVTLGTDAPRSFTYAELSKCVDRFAAQLHADGLRAGDSVALMLKNGPEWVIADLAIARCGGIVVPIHTTYTRSYVETIMQHAHVRYLCIDRPLYDKMSDLFQTSAVRKVYFSDVDITSVSQSSLSLPEPYASRLDDVHTIVYTSGTTGHPKGVELTHRNILSNVHALLKHIPIYPSDRFFSFLPLSHILERTAGYYVPVLAGASIGYARSIETVAEDMVIAEPTVLISVPRIFERIHEKIIKKVSAHPVVHGLFSRAHRAAVRKLEGRLSFTDRVMYYIGEKLIFHKVRIAFGGKLRFAVSGGAALPKHIAEFFESLGVLILEGYGLTETSPVLTANRIEAHRFGTVGMPLASAQVRIAPNGEILAKGEAIMKGYHQAPDLTAEVIDTDGWLHTGDLGAIDSSGFLSIIGRIKEMIVLSTGRNVFPVPIEQALEESPLVLQAMIYGDAQRAVAAFIVPEFKNLEAWCEKEHVTYRLPDTLSDKRVIHMYAEELKKMLEHFQHFEQVRHFKLIAEKWTMENDMLTLSQKLKRGKILEKYHS